MTIDPDEVEVAVYPSSKIIVVGNRCSLQAVYSRLKEDWKTDKGLHAYEFPLVAHTAKFMELAEGWRLVNRMNITEGTIITLGDKL